MMTASPSFHDFQMIANKSWYIVYVVCDLLIIKYIWIKQLLILQVK